MPYYLDNAFLLDDPWITVVGCGGTGGFVAEGLCRLFQGREANIVLVDHDRVEPHNLLRQNFYPGDVGGFKSQVLADRLARAYGRPMGYLVYPFREYESQPHEHGYPGLPAYRDGLIIGCADNAPARKAMAECLPGDPRRWLIDAGNDTNWGQVLVGNISGNVSWDEPAFTGETCYLAPAPTLQRPDLLTAVSTRPPDVDCAAALDLTDQDPTINQMMASLVLQVVRRMVAGTLPPSWPSTWTWTRARSHPPTSPRRRWSGRWGSTLSDRRTRTHSENEQGRRNHDRQERDHHDHDHVAGQAQRAPQAQADDEGVGGDDPPLYANEYVEDYDSVLAPVKLFSPYNGWTWYITEWQAETGLCFGLVEGFETELGYFHLDELAEATVFGGVPAVERDLYWEPTTLGEIKRKSRLAA